MIRALIQIFNLLNSDQKKNLIFLQFLIILMVLLEICSVLLLGQYVFIISNIENLYSIDYLEQIKLFLNINNPTYFIIFFTTITLIIILSSTILSIYTLWKLSMYGAKIGVELSIKLFNFYINQNWIFHTKNNSSKLINKILNESGRVNSAIIQPFMHMNARGVLAIGLVVSIFVYNFWASFFGTLIFSLAYALLYFTIRRKLYINGKIISQTQSSRLSQLAESFGGIKDIILYNRKNYFSKKFKSSSDNYAYSYGITQVLMTIPKYIIEFVAIIFLTLLTLIFVYFKNRNLIDILPFLSIFAFAAFKLLPSFQQIYSSISSIKANIPAFENIKNELSNSFRQDFILNANDNSVNKKVTFNKSVFLKDISFSYDDKLILENINLEIKKYSTVGFAGASGCGKSTLMDIILGLISAKKGAIVVDDLKLDKSNIRNWQNYLGFVSQNIFLKDSSILENIAFGVDKDEINYELLDNVIKMSSLNNFIDDLPDGYNTIVGERGIQLSGGQRQRIGIARALYQDSEFLVFDEATSSLDMISEKQIINSINRLSRKKTIVIVAHRLITLKNCDCIYLMDKGKIVDKGNYDYLLASSDLFREMNKNLKINI